MLRSSFYSFETARSAIIAGQYGLDTVGHNLSNMNTYGYTRQRVDQASFVTSSNSKYAVYGRQLPGQGSMITGISQIRDTSLDVRYRQESSNWGELAIKSTYYAEMSSIFDEITTEGLDVYFEKLLDAISKMSSTPTDSDQATVVRSLAEQICSIMNIYSDNLDKVEAEMLEDLELTITSSVNVILEQIGELNKQIERSQLCGQNANELMDTRNLLIDQLSELVPINVTYKAVKVSDNVHIERLVITIPGVTPGSTYELINGKDYGSLALTSASGTTPVTIDVIDTSGTSTNITDELSKGGLKGYIDLLNGKGTFAATGENDSRGIQYYRAMFDELAKQFADTMNGINGQPLFIADDPLPGTQITAKNITITTAWRNNPMHLTVTNNSPAGDLDNDVLMKFIKLLGPNAQVTFTTGTGGQTLNTSFQKYCTTFNAELALDASTNASLFKTSNTTMNTLYDNRDSISGVSMNEEGINMMMYQNYYSAASRYLTTLDEALNLIISGMGLVGR